VGHWLGNRNGAKQDYIQARIDDGSLAGPSRLKTWEGEYGSCAMKDILIIASDIVWDTGAEDQTTPPETIAILLECDSDDPIDSTLPVSSKHFRTALDVASDHFPDIPFIKDCKMRYAGDEIEIQDLPQFGGYPSGYSGSIDVPPNTRLNLEWIGAPGMTNCSVMGTNLGLTFSCTSGVRQEKKEKIVPSKEAWEKFLRVMDEVKVWEWEERYDNNDIMGGLVWGLRIQHGDQNVTSSGRNGYPGFGEGKTGFGEPSNDFKKYERAVAELIGRPLWKE